MGEKTQDLVSWRQQVLQITQQVHEANAVSNEPSAIHVGSEDS
jgi:hypothetical protein